MFKAFVKLVDYDITPKTCDIENLFKYENLCNLKINNVKIEEAQELVSEASVILKDKYPSITPRILDHQIWKKMSSN